MPMNRDDKKYHEEYLVNASSIPEIYRKGLVYKDDLEHTNETGAST